MSFFYVSNLDVIPVMVSLLSVGVVGSLIPNRDLSKSYGISFQVHREMDTLKIPVLGRRLAMSPIGGGPGRLLDKGFVLLFTSVTL